MIAEFNILDWLVAAGQGLFGASFFHFLYLVIRCSPIAPIISYGSTRQSKRNFHGRYEPESF